MKKLILSLALLFSAVLTRAEVSLVTPIVLTFSTVTSETGVSLQVIDLKGIGATSYTDKDKVAVELEVTTNATAPGAARTLTCYYGFSVNASLTAAQMATASSNQVCAIANAATTTRLYSLPVVYASGRYLYLWFDHTARDASSTLTITIRASGVGR